MTKIGDEVFRPIIRALDDAPVHMRQLRDVVDGLKAKQIRNRDGVSDVDKFDTPGGNGPTYGPHLPNPNGDGPVHFNVPEGASPAEVAQFHDYVNRSNQYLADGQLSSAGRVTTKGEIAADARDAARAERNRAAGAGTPYQGVVAHVPDSTWVGQGTPPGWGDYTSRVNSSLAGQVNRYPVGYNPTMFVVRE
ncbi:hypothetical protein [Microbacterium sp. NPDC087665]|uniref:hypothetical protein n=1 Tax=Microbacterium sp. NPDC087665 TaxID=3364194 RepID=UPI0037FC43E1